MPEQVATLVEHRKPNEKQFGDICAVHGIEIKIERKGLLLWVNVDGVCALRIFTDGMTDIVIEDDRRKE